MTDNLPTSPSQALWRATHSFLLGSPISTNREMPQAQPHPQRTRFGPSAQPRRLSLFCIDQHFSSKVLKPFSILVWAEIILWTQKPSSKICLPSLSSDLRATNELPNLSPEPHPGRPQAGTPLPST